MRYIKIQAKDFNAALYELRIRYGDDAIPISHKPISLQKFPLNIFAEKGIELTAAVDDDPKKGLNIKRNESGEIILQEEDNWGLKDIERDYELTQKTILRLKTSQDAERAVRLNSSEAAVIFNPVPDTLNIDIGYRLIPLADPEQGGFLADRITNMRKMITVETGLPLSPIRVRNNNDIEPNQYVISIRGVETARASIRQGKALAMDRGSISGTIDGEECCEPVFGLDALWIDKDKSRAAQRKGYAVMDCEQIITTHLSENIKSHAHEILSLQDVQFIIEAIKNDYPILAECIAASDRVSLLLIHSVLQNLLRERVRIVNLVIIIETILKSSESTTDRYVLTNNVRSALSRQICGEYAGRDRVLQVIRIDTEIESMIWETLQTDTGRGIRSKLDEQSRKRILEALKDASRAGEEKGPKVFMTQQGIRHQVFYLIEGVIENAAVLSEEEIAPGFTIETAGRAVLKG